MLGPLLSAVAGNASVYEERLRDDLAAARRELAEITAEIAAERAKIVKNLTAAREQIVKLEEQVTTAETERLMLSNELNDKEQKLNADRALIEFLDTVVSEFRRNQRLSSAEQQLYDQQLLDIDRLLTADTAAERLQAFPPLFALFSEYIQNRLERKRFAGKAVNDKGEILDGTFVIHGPLAYFAAADGSRAGVVFNRPNSPLPAVYTQFKTAVQNEIRNLAAGKQALAPVDVTLGSAVVLDSARETFQEHISKGGITMIPLLMLGLMAALLGFYKLVTLPRLNQKRAERGVRAILTELQANNTEAALQLARRLPAPLGPTMTAGINHRDTHKEHLEEIMYEHVMVQMPRLERFLAPLAVCASVAPLLGLLGTVTGMIHTFRLITVFGTGDARLLSAGISEALITTEFGLLIAVPALLLHAYLSRNVRRTIAATQQAGMAFVNGLKLKPIPDAIPGTETEK